MSLTVFKYMKCKADVSGLGMINIIRWKSFLSVEIDPKCYDKEGNLKPRKHPGICSLKQTTLPPNILKILPTLVGNYPIKKLLNDSKKLNQFIHSRHPPPERSEIKAKLKEVIKEIDDANLTIKNGHDDNVVETCKKYEHRQQQLIRRKMRERIYAWKPINYGQYEALMYAMGRSALEYAVLKSIMNEILLRDENFKPQSYFDFGSGIGTGMWASSSIWRNTIYEYFNVDNSRSMNDLSELILCNGSENQKMSLQNVFYRQWLPALETKYDLVICSYTLFELPNKQTRREVIFNLWKRCSGYLIMVEEGTRKGTEILNDLKNYILSLKDISLIGHVFAPCSHNKQCPRLEEIVQAPCNFEVSFMQPLWTTSAQYPSTARYSYIVLKKGNPKQNIDPVWPRIVRPTLIRSKHVICRMCTQDGKLQEIIFTKAKHDKISYACAKASKWGDRLPIIIKDNNMLT